MSFATLIRRKQVHLKTLIVATRCINAYCNTLLLYVDGFDNDKLQQSVLYSATLQHNFSTDPTKDCLQNQCPCFGCNGSFFCRRKNLKSLRNRLKWTSGQFRILPPAKQERSIKDVAFRISMLHFHDLAISGILKFPAFFCLAATIGDLRFIANHPNLRL